MQYVLITGATGGIGLALSKVFAKNGYGLVLTGTNASKLAAAKRMLVAHADIPIYIFRQDLSATGAAAALYAAIRQENIDIDILINNAGFGVLGPADKVDDSLDEKMMDVNMQSVVELCKLFLRDMYKRGSGKILNVSSTGAFVPGPYTASYYAAKSFVLSYTKAIRYEAKKNNVQVCALCPGTTKTGFFVKAGADTPIWAMDPMKVAVCAYKGLMKNKAVIIPGIANQMMCHLPEKIKIEAIARLKK